MSVECRNEGGITGWLITYHFESRGSSRLNVLPKGADMTSLVASDDGRVRHGYLHAPRQFVG